VKTSIEDKGFTKSTPAMRAALVHISRVAKPIELELWLKGCIDNLQLLTR
jgi:hypothetical protein